MAHRKAPQHSHWAMQPAGIPPALSAHLSRLSTITRLSPITYHLSPITYHLSRPPSVLTSALRHRSSTARATGSRFSSCSDSCFTAALQEGHITQHMEFMGHKLTMCQHVLDS